MSSPAVIRREIGTRLWIEGPILSLDEQTVYWGSRNIPVSQLNDEGRKMFGLEPLADSPVTRTEVREPTSERFSFKKIFSGLADVKG